MHSPGNANRAGDSANASDAERNRRLVEHALRAVAFIALVFALVRVAGWWPERNANVAAAPFVVTSRADRDTIVAARANGVANGGANAATNSLIQTLRNAHRDPTHPHGVHLSAAIIPTQATRALLAAGKAAGIDVRWSDATRNAAVALAADALVDPRGGYSVRIAAPPQSALAIRDTLGLIDSVRAKSGGASLRVGRVSGTLSAVSSNGYASVHAPASPVIRRVLVISRPGWEAKFTMAALEELGWKVDARFAITPRVAVTQGNPTTIDTAQYAAVIALDSSVIPAANAIARYAESGGGVIVVGEATTVGAMQALLPGKTGVREVGVPGALVTASPRAGLALWPLSLKSDAVLLERTARGASSTPVVAARRIGAGRLVQIGYDGIWAWRMQGGEGSVAAHRDWWGRLVSSVAFAPMNRASAGDSTLATSLPGNAAPYADLVARLGAPTAMPTKTTEDGSTTRWDAWALIVAALALIGEWGSRRLRGAR